MHKFERSVCIWDKKFFLKPEFFLPHPGSLYSTLMLCYWLHWLCSVWAEILSIHSKICIWWQWNGFLTEFCHVIFTWKLPASSICRTKYILVAWHLQPENSTSAYNFHSCGYVTGWTTYPSLLYAIMCKRVFLLFTKTFKVVSESDRIFVFSRAIQKPYSSWLSNYYCQNLELL